MTFDELKAAYAAGATIQISMGAYGWKDLETPTFDAIYAEDYRVKPTECGGWQCPSCGLMSGSIWIGRANPDAAPVCCRGELMIAYRIPPAEEKTI